MKDKIDAAFIQHAADILAETYTGLSGGQIVKHCNSYAIDFNVDIPIASPDFGKFGSIVPNKRTALYKNLMAFNGKQQFVIIKELCELPIFQKNKEAQELKKRLFERFHQFASGPLYIDDSTAYRLGACGSFNCRNEVTFRGGRYRRKVSGDRDDWARNSNHNCSASV